MSRRREDQPRSVGESLGALTRRLGMPDPALVATITESWADVVGPAIAAHARPEHVRDGTLTVAVDDPAWAAELRYQVPALLDRLSARVGRDAIAAIRVVVRAR